MDKEFNVLQNISAAPSFETPIEAQSITMLSRSVKDLDYTQ